MKIGELAKAASTQTETIRYYEREGLLPEASRSEANYRVYDSTHINRLAFIRHCRSLDMSLGEIRALLHFKDAPTENCTEVNGLLDEHIGHVATRIRELKALEKELKALREECTSGQDAASCGILSGLETAAQAEKKRPGGAGGHAGHIHGTHQRVGNKAKI
ncbi:MAG: Cd(II)/Pb(II)-responsive transcriptional regulator [Rhodoferax sp.]|nr:Cd(II)/Pb(II)-responsive transcriptional regulator [Rhodoferax sp.]MDP3653316.1 Cd(II)/Pb(II)-responsive transcriptional regulator [Rhodoferax sp.]